MEAAAEEVEVAAAVEEAEEVAAAVAAAEVVDLPSAAVEVVVVVMDMLLEAEAVVEEVVP